MKKTHATTISSALFIALAFVFALSPVLARASETSGTISDTSKYAWGENIGWINFAPTQGQIYEGLSVTDTAVTGYAWSSNFGWINFNPTNSGQGVTNTTGGVLGGSAWIQNLGWLSMSGVTIDSSGVLRGVAGVASTTVGRVSFDCDHCTVTTDWRPLRARTVATSTPPQNENKSTPTLSAPRSSSQQLRVETSTSTPPSSSPSDQSAPASPSPSAVSTGSRTGSPQGVVVRNISGRYEAVVSVPAQVSSRGITVVIHQNTVSSATVLGERVFDIIATDSNGQSVHSFSTPLAITLTVPDLLSYKGKVDVRWYDTTRQVWIPVPGVTFHGSSVAFLTDHLTRFAVIIDTPPSAAPVAVTDMRAQDWYSSIIRPSWAPPAWVFGFVWSILYILIALSFGYVFIQIYQKKLRPMIGLPFVLNIFFNLVFSSIQFGFKNNILAAVDIILMLVTLIWAMIVIYPHKKAVTCVQIPYVLWICFALALQIAITMLNR
ncbi:tryptophan-rich sensory protein [bacterium]|nr:tryptophan-rich sensory protein [bacterium]